jgi:hypothetical protein
MGPTYDLNIPTGAMVAIVIVILGFVLLAAFIAGTYRRARYEHEAALERRRRFRETAPPTDSRTRYGARRRCFADGR